MRLDTPYRSLLGIIAALLSPPVWMGCSKSGLATTRDAAASGGATSTSAPSGSGGTPLGSGGTTMVGGDGGSIGSGGMPDTGGKSSSMTGGPPTGGGGTATAGGATRDAGTLLAGGARGDGGTIGDGGRGSLGGTIGDGGRGSLGGTIGDGGRGSLGGTIGAGATISLGGTLRSGGTTSAGGAVGTAGMTGGGGGPSLDGGGTGGAMGGSTGTGGGACSPPTVTLTGPDAVANGPLIVFDDQGGWSWFQDERAVVDVKGGKLVVGSTALSGSRQGNIEAVIYDLATGKADPPAKLGNLNPDDFNAPALVVRPDGKYVAVWAGHRLDCNTYYSVYQGSAWGEQMTFDWTTQGCPWDGDATHKVTHSNLWYMGGALLDFARSAGTSPNALASSDDGASWSYLGRLTYAPLEGYLAGYYKYWGNNKDRIDFVGTEAHPRDFNNNLWHGYVQDGKTYNSVGTLVDDGLAGASESPVAPSLDKLTKVFAAGSTVGNIKLEHAWNHDIVRYDDGTIAILGQGRVTGTGTSDPDKRAFYARFDGSKWTLTYLAKMGPKLYADEEDYTGVGALHPDDPTTLFISTPYDPRDDTTKSSKHEIWQGTTCDNGATFQWTPVTANSSRRNIRPIVPKWDSQHTALLWLQGDYASASYTTSRVVGIITGPGR
jgi:hypothetical protein